ncbi:MAG: threonine synthase [Actinobacteria bacterium]|uniref:threonine synthase n=1 Tax=freshwater metagenome TaxID=449393 RepID=A0A6J6A4Q3_9ZZZZ|nr:threonine synthase [Actinomycetota bacterium]MSW77153.1 threonine synthase [Actinomycetota bacterium]MSX55012.1 threonine synthase [Actinomycetota bacterium]MSX92016.1 threonine synthase [Actinomycetota bacterium]MSZ82979.1 threonine synthase [Actinomycetota bacterium]
MSSTRYVSTRGLAPELGFTEVLLAGLANDGGLYVPKSWPVLPACSPGATYAERAAQIIQLFVGDDLSADTVLRLCNEAYATFAHPAVVPLVQLQHGHFVQELFHGPTLAFKDVALQLVGRMFDAVLREQGRRVTIVGATSGDTGSAAIDGVKNCANVDIVILYPHHRTSDVQRKQMTTVQSPNVRVVAVEGTFDDCQDMVKAMFNDVEFRERIQLSAVNSINWARVMAQIVYYIVATDLLAGPINVCVPSGNFGNVFSGWIARRMGAPIDQLVVASNANDILERFFNRNDMSAAPVVPSLSPSMDIQVSSNFERLLFEMNARDGGLTAEQLQRFRTSGSLSVEPDQRAAFLDGRFQAARLDDSETLEVIARTYREAGMLLDPHSAVGVGAVEKLRTLGTLTGTTVTLATAHPAKFPDAVERATGVRPPLPPHLADLFDLPEHLTVLPNDLATVQHFVATAFR